MKRIAMSLAAIALVAAVAVGATRAYFSDNTSNLTGITFSTGDANLKISQICTHLWYDGTVTLSDFNNVYAGCQFTLNPENYYPGFEVDNQAIHLGNFSSANIALNPSIQLKNYTQSVAGLQNVMYMKIWWNGNGTGTDWHPLSYFINSPVTNLPQVPAPSSQPVASDGSNAGKVFLNFDMKMLPSAGNQYQDATANFDIHFNAEQAH